MINNVFNQKAHEKQRRADALLREGKFEEAAKCHETVSDLLAKAYMQIEAGVTNINAPALTSQETPKFLTSVHSLVTLESLNLQRDYHKRQAAVVRYISCNDIICINLYNLYKFKLIALLYTYISMFYYTYIRTHMNI